ncbi:MAG: acyl-CoA desaturase [Betaproteobacteria bacterium]|nr:acyl-CoA desaturase [Betaproteobacteria bacterium]
MVWSGLLDLPWWGYVLTALAMTHVTIAGVTIFLHRCQAHRALDLHPIASHFFRLWMWLTTGQVTKEWAAVHRKHHARVETPEDPHSPQVHGLKGVLFGGVFLYHKASRDRDIIERFGHGTPDDWIERNLYTKHSFAGVVLMATIDLMLFGCISGALIFVTQILWIPFWAAGVINGVGHFLGYRNFGTTDASRNILPWGILIGGEELHNNHHAHATSAKLSSRWYEFDIGWFYISVLQCFGLAQVKKVASTPRFVAAKSSIDFETLQSVITHRYDVLSNYALSLKKTYHQEIERLRALAPHDAKLLRGLRHWLGRDDRDVPEGVRPRLTELMNKSSALQTVRTMRQELGDIWARSTATREQLLRQLQEWCHRAEASGVTPLVEFARSLRCYA